MLHNLFFFKFIFLEDIGVPLTKIIPNNAINLGFVFVFHFKTVFTISAYLFQNSIPSFKSSVDPDQLASEEVILCVFLSSADFFKIIFLEKFFQKHHQSVKQF